MRNSIDKITLMYSYVNYKNTFKWIFFNKFCLVTAELNNIPRYDSQFILSYSTRVIRFDKFTSHWNTWSNIQFLWC